SRDASAPVTRSSCVTHRLTTSTSAPCSPRRWATTTPPGGWSMRRAFPSSTTTGSPSGSPLDGSPEPTDSPGGRWGGTDPVELGEPGSGAEPLVELPHRGPQSRRLILLPEVVEDL